MSMVHQSYARQLDAAHRERQNKFWSQPKGIIRKAISQPVKGLAIYSGPIGPDMPPYALAWARLGPIPAAILTMRDATPVDERLVSSRRVLISEVCDAVLEVTGVSRADFFSERRLRTVVRARQIAYFVARELTQASFPQIGNLCGKRDHSTVMHGCNRIAREIDKWKPLIDAVVARIAESGVRAQG